MNGLRHLFLIDGSGFVFRAFHALPPLTRPDGTPVGAVYGFTNMLMKLVEDSDADALAVIFDAGRETFRNKIYPAYKAQRPELPEELIVQFPLVREATRALKLPAVELEGFEADDLIATYARRARAGGARVTIVSSDKDMMQLVEDGIDMMDPIRGRKIGPGEVIEKFGVPPERVVDVQALAGDSSDNVPGVPGVGVKTAAALIKEYGDLDTLLARAGEIKQPKRRQALMTYGDQARLSRDLVRLRDDVPVPEPLESFAKKAPDPKLLLDFLRAQDFKKMAARVGARLAARGAASAAAPAGGSEMAPPETHYELVQKAEDLKVWLDRARVAGCIAVDTETTSLDATRAELVGVSLSLEAGHGCYVPLGHKAPAAQGSLDLAGGGARDGAGAGDGAGDGGGPASSSAPGTVLPGQIPLETALSLLKPLLADPAVLKVGHNIKYDMLVLRHYGVEVTPVDDTMVLSYVLEGGLHGHGLDELAELHLGHDTIKYKEVAGTGKARVTFDLVAMEVARDYAAEDADITGRLHRLLKPRLVREHMVTVYETLERPLIPLLVDMEAAGILVDHVELKKLSRDFARRLAALEAEIHALAGHPFTIGSPKQLGEVLFDEMGLAGGRRGKSGSYGTGADVLESLAAQGCELAAKVLAWRQLAKLKSTYADALVNQINPRTGRVHTSFSMAATSTGRLASSDPNVQNIPIRTEEGRKIRRAFVAAPGHKLLSVDYSQIELRLAAHVADVEALKQAFREGADIHARTAAQVFGVPIEGMDPMVRRKAKAINFGIIYGISPFGLAQQLAIPQREAAAYIAAYFERYPALRTYMEETKEFCRAHGYVETLFGRKCFIPGINDKNPARRSFAERAAINAPLQGAAADIIKRAMIRTPPRLVAAGLGARMLLQVHDELLFEVPEGEVAATAKLVCEVMEGAPAPAVQLSVPLVAEAGIGDNWADAH